MSGVRDSAGPLFAASQSAFFSTLYFQSLIALAHFVWMASTSDQDSARTHLNGVDVEFRKVL